MESAEIRITVTVALYRHSIGSTALPLNRVDTTTTAVTGRGDTT